VTCTTSKKGNADTNVWYYMRLLYDEAYHGTQPTIVERHSQADCVWHVNWRCWRIIWQKYPSCSSRQLTHILWYHPEITHSLVQTQCCQCTRQPCWHCDARFLLSSMPQPWTHSTILITHKYATSTFAAFENGLAPAAGQGVMWNPSAQPHNSGQLYYQQAEQCWNLQRSIRLKSAKFCKAVVA
jgi:hypothetical protein